MHHPPAYVEKIDAAALTRDPVGRLATDIVALYRESGCATEADLKRRGWTPSKLARYIDDARERARDRLDADAAATAELEVATPSRRPRRPRKTPPAVLGQGRRSRSAR